MQFSALNLCLLKSSLVFFSKYTTDIFKKRFVKHYFIGFYHIEFFVNIVAVAFVTESNYTTNQNQPTPPPFLKSQCISNKRENIFIFT